MAPAATAVALDEAAVAAEAPMEEPPEAAEAAEAEESLPTGMSTTCTSTSSARPSRTTPAGVLDGRGPRGGDKALAAEGV